MARRAAPAKPEPLAVVMKRLDELEPYDRNARTHSDAQIEQLCASIRQFGWTNPILLDGRGRIVAGHGRMMAARSMGLTEAPCIELRHLTDTQRRAYILADNQLALNAGWDEELLRLEMGDLRELEFDLDIIGFSDSDLAGIFAQADGLTDPDDVPSTSEIAVSVPGDVWLLGSHRLACGDCTDANVVEAALFGTKPHLMVTDPPYGVDYDPDWRNRSDRANGKPYGDRAIGLVVNDTRSDWSPAFRLFPGSVVYSWHPPGARSVVFYHALETAGFDVRMQIIWAKNVAPIGRGNYHVQHEPCWYAVRKGETAHWQGSRKQTTLWEIDKPVKSETGHSTQKPVECMRRPIENNSKAGDAVYDPFCGSGTTIIAAEMTGRACCAIEVCGQYCDVSILRWQQFTGQTARLEADGRSFDEVKVSRLGTTAAEFAA